MRSKRSKALRSVVWVMFALALNCRAMQDPNLALDWHELLKSPNPMQLMDLAVRYENGEGMHHDYGRARQLYCAAARLGHTPAQRRLAWMYAHGLGAPQDKELAGAWLRVASAKGDRQARNFLALLGYPDGGRQPRCTYMSRFDEYARAAIEPVRGHAEPAWLAELAGRDGAHDSTRQQIEAWVRELAPRYGLDPRLILSVIAVESNFDPRARSPKNAQGLMQLIPDTAVRFGVRDVTHPLQNLHGGMAYLRWLLAYFRGDLRLALAGYNAGEGAVEQYRGIPPYRETQNYVRKVLRAFGKTTHPRVEQVVAPSSILSANLAGPRPR